MDTDTPEESIFHEWRPVQCGSAHPLDSSVKCEMWGGQCPVDWHRAVVGIVPNRHYIEWGATYESAKQFR